jgi:hypothetical protein
MTACARHGEPAAGEGLLRPPFYFMISTRLARLCGRLANKERHGHFLAAIDGEADLVFPGVRDLKIGNADDDRGAGRRSTRGNLDINLLRRRGGLHGVAIGINDRKADFLEPFFNLPETQFSHEAATNAYGKLGDKNNVRSAKDMKFTIGAGARGVAKGQDFCRHVEIVSCRRVLSIKLGEALFSDKTNSENPIRFFRPHPALTRSRPLARPYGLWLRQIPFAVSQAAQIFPIPLRSATAGQGRGESYCPIFISARFTKWFQRAGHFTKKQGYYRRGLGFKFRTQKISSTSKNYFLRKLGFPGFCWEIAKK